MLMLNRVEKHNGLSARMIFEQTTVAADLATSAAAEVISYRSYAPGAVAVRQLVRDLGPCTDDATIDHTISVPLFRAEKPAKPRWNRGVFDRRKPGWVR